MNKLALALLSVASAAAIAQAAGPCPQEAAVLDTRPPGVGPTVRVLLAQGEHEHDIELPDGGTLVAAGEQRAVEPGKTLHLVCEPGTVRLDGIESHDSITLEPNPLVTKSHLHFAAEGHNEQFEFDGRPYRGSLELRPTEGGVQAINCLGLEAYLYGVVPRELSTDTLEAVRAQAVVSRTYAVGHLSPGHPYDLRGDTLSQAYAGIKVETIRTRHAIDDTAGQVLYYHGRIAKDVCFHATCGGQTAANDEVFTHSVPVPYLRSVVCGPTAPERSTEASLASCMLPQLDQQGPEGYCSDSPFYRWTVSWPRTTLEDSLRRVLNVPATAGALTEISPVALSATGRVERLEARFTGATEVVSGDAIRRALAFQDPAGKVHDLYSTWFTIQYDPTSDTFTATGKGWGHGVGMCQWGAIGMARQGHTYDEILRHYFPGTDLAALH